MVHVRGEDVMLKETSVQLNSEETGILHHLLMADEKLRRAFQTGSASGPFGERMQALYVKPSAASATLSLAILIQWRAFYGRFVSDRCRAFTPASVVATGGPRSRPPTSSGTNSTTSFVD
jgi:hypothetical protein